MKESESKIILEEYFYSNGNIEFSVETYNGKKHGKATYWDDLGNLINEVDYKMDKIDGLWISYYISGNVKYRSNYLENKRHGLMIEYYPDGKQKKITTYESDNEITSITFDMHGNKIEN